MGWSQAQGAASSQVVQKQPYLVPGVCSLPERARSGHADVLTDQEAQYQGHSVTHLTAEGFPGPAGGHGPVLLGCCSSDLGQSGWPAQQTHELAGYPGSYWIGQVSPVS